MRLSVDLFECGRRMMPIKQLSMMMVMGISIEQVIGAAIDDLQERYAEQWGPKDAALWLYRATQRNRIGIVCERYRHLSRREQRFVLVLLSALTM